MAERRVPDHYALGHRIKRLEEMQRDINSSRLPPPDSDSRAEAVLRRFYGALPDDSRQLSSGPRIMRAAQQLYRQAHDLDMITEGEFRGKSLVSGIWEAGNFGRAWAVKMVYFDSANAEYFFREQTGHAAPENMLEESNRQLKERYGVRVTIPTAPARGNL